MRSCNPSTVSTGGTVLDPSSLANANRVGQESTASCPAFEDADRNGVEDHRR
jgi:hypothetical protein